MVELDKVPSEKDAPFEAPEPARRLLDADVDALLGAGSADATPQVRRLAAALCIKNWTELEESGELEPGVVRELQRFLLIVANQPEEEWGASHTVTCAWRLLVLQSVSRYVSLWAPLGFEAPLDFPHGGTAGQLRASRAAYSATFKTPPPPHIWGEADAAEEDGQPAVAPLLLLPPPVPATPFVKCELVSVWVCKRSPRGLEALAHVPLPTTEDVARLRRGVARALGVPAEKVALVNAEGRMKDGNSLRASGVSRESARVVASVR